LQIRAIGGASKGSKKGGKPESVTFYKGRCGGSGHESETLFCPTIAPDVTFAAVRSVDTRPHTGTRRIEAREPDFDHCISKAS